MHFSVSLSDTLEQLSSCGGGERGENCAGLLIGSVPTPTVYGIASLRSHLNPQPCHRAPLQLFDAQKPMIQEANVRERKVALIRRAAIWGQGRLI